MITELLPIALGFLPFAVLGIVDVCSFDQMLDNSNCIDKLSEREKLAASVFYLCQELKACNGSETCTVDSLQTEVACLKEVSENRLKSIDVYGDFLSAVAGGAVVTGTMDEIQTNIKCLKLIDDHTLKAMITRLRCYLRQCVS